MCITPIPNSHRLWKCEFTTCNKGVVTHSTLEIKSKIACCTEACARCHKALKKKGHGSFLEIPLHSKNITTKKDSYSQTSTDDFTWWDV